MGDQRIDRWSETPPPQAAAGPWTRVWALLAALLIAGTGAPVQADAPTGMAACAAVDDPAARLACYDRASGRTPTAASSAGGSAAAGVTPPAKPMSAPTVPVAGESMPEPATPRRADADASLLTRAWSFEPDSERYLIKLYRPNYLAPVRYQSRTNNAPFTPLLAALNATDDPHDEVDNLEAAFQISFKTRFWASEDRRLGAWFAYTQQSFWQIYNGDNSSPFRDTNYEPELKLTWQPRWSFGGFDWRLLSIGYNHESNGRADPISRSWDRLVAEVGIEKDNFALLLRPWVRIDDAGEDNPDITDYYGYGDLTAIYKWRGHSFTLMGRGNPAEKKGALRVTWMTPPLVGPLRGYLVGFSGWGDTLLDYNFKQNAISAGIALNDLLDR